MAVNEPVTVWTPTSGNGEAGRSDGSFIDTEDGFDLATEAGDSLVIEDGTLTAIPATVWTENDGL